MTLTADDVTLIEGLWACFVFAVVGLVGLLELRRRVERWWELLRRWRKGEPMRDAANIQYKMGMRFHRAGEAAELAELESTGHPIWRPSASPDEQNKGDPPPPA